MHEHYNYVHVELGLNHLHLYSSSIFMCDNTVLYSFRYIKVEHTLEHVPGHKQKIF